MNRNYQENYADDCAPMYDKGNRTQKAKRILAVINDACGQNLKNLSVLDVGCSTGIIDNFLAPNFKEIIGIDIDKKAVEFAQKNKHPDNVIFEYGDAMNLQFPDASYDIVIANHIYEHVPDAKKLFAEIYRVLAPGGICCLAAVNRLQIIEPHYHLPFLSILPRFLVPFYYEKPLTYWQLKRLTKNFQLTDYTQEILKDSTKFQYQDTIRPKTVKAKILAQIGKFMPWLSPTFIWILKKPL